MKKIKRNSLFLIIIIFIIGAGGCMNNSNTNVELIDTLNEKYDDTFELISSGNELWDEEYSESIFSSSNLDGALITVWTYEDGTIDDNYIAIKYKTEVEASIKQLADVIYGPCIVINKPTKLAKEHFTKDMTSAEYMADRRSDVMTDIITNAPFNVKEEMIEKLRIALENNNICSDIKLYYYNIPIEEVNTNVGEHEAYDPVPEHNGRLLLNADYTIWSLRWSE